jgi:serine/threonine-protein kinase
LSAPTVEIDSGSGAVLDGRFRVGRHLARGGMGEVHEGLDLSLGRPVAIKFLAQRFVSDADVVTRFRREAESLASLAHPNVVPVHAVGDDGGRPYFVMTLIRGQTLDQLVRERGPLPIGAVVHVGVQVCRGLERVHSAGYVHRDIKPSNLMIDSSGHCVLLDFGILRELESQLTVTGYIVGTPEYMSPEQARAARLAEPRSDLYSLGATLYAALTGAPPFRGESSYEIIDQHHNARAAPPSTRVRGLPRSVDSFFRTALAKEPAQRFADAAAMNDALSALAPAAWLLPAPRPPSGGGDTSEVRGELRARTLTASRRRMRALGTVALLGVAATVTTLALVLSPSSRVDPPPAGEIAATNERRPPILAPTNAERIAPAPTSPAPPPAARMTPSLAAPNVPRATEPDEARTETSLRARAPARSRARGATRPSEHRAKGAPEPEHAGAESTTPSHPKRDTPPSPPAAPLRDDSAPKRETAPLPTVAPKPLEPARLRIVTLHQGLAAWAHISIDGERAGTSPIPRHELRPGRHTITATRDGYRPAHTTVDMRAGESRKVTLELEREAP